MKRILTLLLTFLLSLNVISYATGVFINEIHYDNVGIDANEVIEIAGPSGFDLTGWSIVLYNGSNGLIYDTRVLSNIIPNQQNGFGTLSYIYPVNGIQNGSPDAIAIADKNNSLIQFISYEGLFVALNGPAIGILSNDIGVMEKANTPLGFSLQLSGNGSIYEDFIWTNPIQNTFGSINTGQTFTAPVFNPVPEPTSLMIICSSLIGIVLFRGVDRRHHRKLNKKRHCRL